MTYNNVSSCLHEVGSVADSKDPTWRSTTVLYVLGYFCFATSAIQSTQYVTCHFAFTKSVGSGTTEAERSLAIVKCRAGYPTTTRHRSSGLECKAFMQMEFATNPTARIKKCTRSALLSGSGGGMWFKRSVKCRAGYPTTTRHRSKWLECKAFMQMEFATNPRAGIKNAQEVHF